MNDIERIEIRGRIKYHQNQIEEISKLLWKKESGYEVIERGGKRFVSIGHGDEDEPLTSKYKISGIEIYQVFDDGYNVGWGGCIPQVEYYVTEEFYKNNIDKFKNKL